MTTDVTQEAILTPFQLNNEIARLEMEQVMLNNKLVKLRATQRAASEEVFLAKLAQLCNEHGMRIVGSSDRDGRTDLYLEPLRANVTLKPSNVLENEA